MKIFSNYPELDEYIKAKIHALPVKYAFSDEQFKRIMNEWGFDPLKDTDKVLQMGVGAFYRKADSEIIRETFEEVEEVREESFKADKTGERNGFLYTAFYTVLADHEYCVTYDPDEALSALGMEYEELSPIELKALKLAGEDYLKDVEK